MVVGSGCGCREARRAVSYLQQVIGPLTEVVGVAEVERPEVAEEGLIDLRAVSRTLRTAQSHQPCCQHCMHIRVPQGG